MAAASYTSRSSSSRRSLSNVGISSTALSHTVSSIDDTKEAVVIELGRKFTKIGVAGEYTPRSICRTQYLDDMCSVRQDVLDGYDNAKKPNETALLHFFKMLYYKKLLIVPRDRRVILVESILYPTEFRRALCRVLMEILDVPSILFLPSHLCATFPFNTDNALVVEMGYLESVAIPVATGVSMLNNHEITALGACRLEERVAELLKEHGSVESVDGELRSISEDEMARIREKNRIGELAHRTDWFSAPVAKEDSEYKCGGDAQMDPKVDDGRVPFGGETLIVPGFVREASCEIFFSGGSVDEPALPHMISSLINKLPIDLRKLMFSGLLVTGGPSLIYGFLPRLKEELQALDQEYGQKVATTIKFYKFRGEGGAALYLYWLGGAMFSSVREAVPCRSISRQYWLEHKKVPDWTDYVAHNWDTFMDSTGQIRSQLLDHFHSSSFPQLLPPEMIPLRPPDPRISIAKKSLAEIGFKVTSSDRMVLGPGGVFTLRKRHELSVQSVDCKVLFSRNVASSADLLSPNAKRLCLQHKDELKVFSVLEPQQRPVVLRDGIYDWRVGAATAKRLCLPHLAMRGVDVTHGQSSGGNYAFGSTKYIVAGQGRPTVILPAQLVCFTRFDGKDYLVCCQKADSGWLVNDLDLADPKFENGRPKFKRNGICFECDPMDEPIVLFCGDEKVYLFFGSGQLRIFDLSSRTCLSVQQISSTKVIKAAGDGECGIMYYTKLEIVHVKFEQSRSDVLQLAGDETGEEGIDNAGGTTTPDEAALNVAVPLFQPDAVEMPTPASLDLIRMKQNLREEKQQNVALRREVAELSERCSLAEMEREDLKRQLERALRDVASYKTAAELKMDCHQKQLEEMIEKGELAKMAREENGTDLLKRLEMLKKTMIVEIDKVING